MVRDETLSLRIMFLCFATAAVVVVVQWQSGWFRSTIQAYQMRAFSSAPTSSASVQTALLSLPKTNSAVIVDLSDRLVYVYLSNRLQSSYPIAVGQPGWETPAGTFRVLHMRRNPFWKHPITGEVIPPGSKNPLGERWIGFIAGGETEIGFHGTNEEDLIGMAVSHGCIRMRNRDIRAMYEQVSIGTPVTVRP